MSAAEVWRQTLAAWAIPDHILASAPVSPWGFSVAGFVDRARRHRAEPTPAHDIAREALPQGGAVLDVGCGGGAASLPLVPPAARLTGVDQSPGMLAAFEAAARATGAAAEVVQGTWPEVAARLDPASHDVVIAQDVLYNVPDADAFLRACDKAARQRVVVVLPTVHPMTWTTPYWRALHGLPRPTRPTVDDAVALLQELGFEVERTSWREPTMWAHATLDDAVEMVRTRLCLPPDRDEDVRAALQRDPPPVTREAVALWWDVGR